MVIFWCVTHGGYYFSMNVHICSVLALLSMCTFVFFFLLFLHYFQCGYSVPRHFQCGNIDFNIISNANIGNHTGNIDLFLLMPFPIHVLIITIQTLVITLCKHWLFMLLVLLKGTCRDVGPVRRGAAASWHWACSNSPVGPLPE